MRRRKVRNLAVTGITIASATALTALTATGAFAATAASSAPGHVTAPRAAAATACVGRSFGFSNTYQQCVDDLQVLLNDLWYAHVLGPDGLISTDGFYGLQTGGDVASFNSAYDISGGVVTETWTWQQLCTLDKDHGFHGTYWQNAGCASVT